MTRNERLILFLLAGLLVALAIVVIFLATYHDPTLDALFATQVP